MYNIMRACFVSVQLLKSVVSAMRQVIKVGITDAELTRAKLVSSQP